MRPPDVVGPARGTRARPRALGWASLLAVLALPSCLSGTDRGVSGPATCSRPSAVPNATGCALVFGTVTNSRGESLDGIEGSVRVPARCGCLEAILQVDDRGVFSVTVYRTATGADTVTGTVVAQATAAKYPRHVTGAPYFDTAQVVLRFAATGSAPVPVETRLRIPLPGS